METLKVHVKKQPIQDEKSKEVVWAGKLQKMISGDIQLGIEMLIQSKKLDKAWSMTIKDLLSDLSKIK